LNASYLYSNQELNADKVTAGIQADFTKQKGKFTGASDLLNADPTLLMNGMIKIII
jgi:hypothetical protein